MIPCRKRTLHRKQTIVNRPSTEYRHPTVNRQPHCYTSMSFIALDPFLPLYAVGIYCCISFLSLILCLLSMLGIFRTKKTPYASKILAMCLLSYDSLFLILSSVTKFFKYTDLFVITQTCRGFQIAAQIVVGGMAIERLFVLNWPYVYLRIATDRIIRIFCVTLQCFSFLQYVGVRTLICYARNKAINCGKEYAVYFVLVSFFVPIISFTSYIKIYRILRQKGKKEINTRQQIRQYKGTLASFFVLINSTVTQFITLGLSVLYFVRTASGTKEDGLVANLADCANLINCIVDPLIYVIWFRETRMEVLKVLQGLCPCVTQTVEKMRMDSFNITTPSFRDKD